jgi:hypothetical protein
LPDGIWAGEYFVNGVPEGGDQQLAALFAYWLTLGKASKLPRRRDFDPTEVPNLLTNIALLDVIQVPFRFKYRLMGDRVIQLREGNHTGQWLHDIYPNFDQSTTYRRIISVVETRQPIWCIGQPTHHSRNEFRLREVIHLPFAEDGETVDLLLSAVLVHR